MLVVDIEWIKTAQRYHFQLGLNHNIKEELVRVEFVSILDSLVDPRIKIKDHLAMFHQEKKDGPLSFCQSWLPITNLFSNTLGHPSLASPLTWRRTDAVHRASACTTWNQDTFHQAAQPRPDLCPH